jgi:aminoglycoside phosphotransferase (APT) family kinase protein
VIGLLDWELSTIGHPLSDLANLLQPLQLSAEEQLEPTSPNGGYPPLNTMLEWYQSEAGWDPTPDFPFADAFCLWRTSIISQGIAARYARGQASSSEAKRYGQKMFPLGELSWKTVQQYEKSRQAKGRL